MDINTLKQLDQTDPLRRFRDEFHLPQKNGQPAIYFCGNSLGLQPRQTEEYLKRELVAWQKHGVEGHFTGDMPWVSYHEWAKKPLGHLVGAHEHEVQAIGSLTANLHFLLASFYQPKGKRVKMIIESGAFPSDFYAAHSHMAMKGVNPAEHLIELKPAGGLPAVHSWKAGGEYLPNEEVIAKIKELGDELALVLMPGIQYYTGQFFDIKKITEAAHSVGAYAGFDLAHAVGNMPMHLHDHQADFAVWCTYKYLNSGPGGIGGMYIHERHSANKDFPRLSGWWGHDAKARFKMANEINPIPNVDGWQLSNANVLSTAAHLASLALFEEAGIENLRAKSIKMFDWLSNELKRFSDVIEIITPLNKSERGCQLSLFVKTPDGKQLFEKMSDRGLIADWREPNVIRIAPTPMYNTFEELAMFIQLLEAVIDESK